MIKTPITISGRKIGPSEPPLVIAEIGINHEGKIDKALQMIDDAHAAGCECVKIQTHIVDDEMIYNEVVPGNATETIWNMMKRCSLTESEECAIKKRVEGLGMIFLSTPFSRAAAERLHGMGVDGYKIGSGECNNYPLVEHIAKYGKPIILSTGMNNLGSIAPAVEILRKYNIPYALMHCTSMYPTPYDKVRLRAIEELKAAFNDAVVGLSDHSLGIYTSLASIACGASIVEKHFTSDRSWPGSDVPISILPSELRELVEGVRAIYLAMGSDKEILVEEKPTIDFAYASVVTIRPVAKGEIFTMDNIWCKRPGTGSIRAVKFKSILGKSALRDIAQDVQLSKADIESFE